MTETSSISFQSYDNDPVNTRVSTVERIQPHCEFKIVDDHGQTCAVGQTGEFWAKGYLGMKGYRQDAADGRLAQQDVPDLRLSVHVAQKMGAGLGRGQILLGQMPPQQAILVG